MAEKYKWTEVGLEIWKRKKKKGRVVWPEIGAVAVAPRDPSSAYKNARILTSLSPSHYPPPPSPVPLYSNRYLFVILLLVTFQFDERISLLLSFL